MRQIHNIVFKKWLETFVQLDRAVQATFQIQISLAISLPNCQLAFIKQITTNTPIVF